MGSVDPSSIKWCCMFGELEVSAEVLSKNVIRCQAPPHAPTSVSFYITCGDRMPCSEVREFLYRENLCEPEEEVLQVRFAKLLSLGVDRERLVCSVEHCHKCKLKNSFTSLLSDNQDEWEVIKKNSEFRGYNFTNKNALLQKLLKDLLYEWLICKVHEEGEGPNVLDEEGQVAIHLAAALGYEWAMSSIVAAGVHPRSKDACGNTALYWAKQFGSWP